MAQTQPVNLQQEVGDVLKALADANAIIDAHGLDRTIYHLVKLRASQINKCAFCVKMHIEEARHDGESNERLDRVVVWDQVEDFSEREKAALKWTEALTMLPANVDLGAIRAELRRLFTEGEISVLTATVAMINLWNRFGVSNH